MRYDIDGAMLQTLLPSIAAAEDAVARLDERVLRSVVGEGFAERSHFFDAAARALGGLANSCMSRISFCMMRIWIAALPPTN